MEIVGKYGEVRKTLSQIERSRNIKVLFACESGSRMWGFASPNSDYDARFIYSRPLNSYLGISALRDVIDNKDEPPVNDIDVSGWDIIKACDLVGRSNPQPLEWLRSPIKYYEYKDFTEELFDIAKEFNIKAVMYHYASMALKQYKQYIAGTGEMVVYKKYFYSLQPLFSAIYLDRRPDDLPPVPFNDLWEALRFIPEVRVLKGPIDELLSLKMSNSEESKQKRFMQIDNFIEQNVPIVRDKAAHAFDGRAPDQLRLDHLCRKTIKQFGG